MVVVARFLAVLELFKAGLCDFDQPEALGPLTIALTATDTRDADAEGDHGAEGDRDLGGGGPDYEEYGDE